MKTFRILLLLSLSLFTFSCDKNNEENNFIFNAEYLKQSQWSGTFTKTNSGKTETANFGVVFYTEADGKYSIKWEYASEAEEGTFDYSINGKMLIVTNGYIKGNWLLIQLEKDKMVLEQGTGGENAYKATLNLTRNF